MTLSTSDKNRPFQEFRLRSKWKHKNKESKTIKPPKTKGNTFSAPHPALSPLTGHRNRGCLAPGTQLQQLLEELPWK